ncbi:formyltetrahydrofolate deformylase [Arthrobacter ginsengisoli]|uniref:Formyltetrahydrofolate deformylase n=2 Tax=Arthrobacter ginsengisoli TaxID=1356565 RepID=A0ABU1UIQ5_9MICC|nr:formyltetrahydrofolate deformylase [Arthrobacter ginsengisoli]MDR7085077.1 formyltetrahydrofolate deformylase [Arthrobacter ginsengisoli]
MDTPKSSAAEYVLTLDCPETRGLVHAVSGFLLEQGCDILESKQFDSQDDAQFFMRLHFASAGDSAGGPASLDSLREAFVPVAEKFGMQWELRAHAAKHRVLIMVSKFEHCLNDLLFRARIGELPIDIVGVVSNHQDHRGIVEWHGIPFFHVPVTADTKPAAEDRLMELVDRLDVELVVLARYMQVLSDDLTRKLDGRAINIHHSFLPSFKGARPYHQAHARGVKTVGATAHYVNAELDEGPIIAQQVVEVDHTFGPEELVAAGRDTERKALSNAVRWHCEGRVFLQGNRTVVLR